MEPAKPKKIRFTSNQLQSSLNALTITFLLAYGGLLLAFYLTPDSGGQDQGIGNLSSIAFAISLLCFLAFYALLWIQAARLNKSPILWAGGALLTSPFGPLLTYILIRGDTKTACHRIAYPLEEMNRIGEEGDLAFQAKFPKSNNPYRFPNTEQENLIFADYWDRGYAVAEKRKKRA